MASSSDFAENELLGVFLMIFGSYHGDWDSTDNLLRAAIAGEGNALTCVWGGRPVHKHYALGAGGTIGDAVRATIESTESIAGMDTGIGGVHIALLGDPTLTAFPVVPASELTVVSSDDHGGVLLEWVGSPDEIEGYHVYRSDSRGGPYERLTDDPVTTTSLEDSLAVGGEWWWMVRAVQRTVTASGSFYNQSQGVFASAEVSCEGGVCEDEPDEVSAVEPEGCGCASASWEGGALWLCLAACAGRRRRDARSGASPTAPWPSRPPRRWRSWWMGW